MIQDHARIELDKGRYNLTPVFCPMCGIETMILTPDGMVHIQHMRITCPNRHTVIYPDGISKEGAKRIIFYEQTAPAYVL